MTGTGHHLGLLLLHLLETSLSIVQVFNELAFQFIHFFHSPGVDSKVGGESGDTWIEVSSTDTVHGHNTAFLFGFHSTFFSSSNVYFVALETNNLAVDSRNDPGTLTETCPFEEKAEAQQEVGNGGGQEGLGECRRHQLPRNGGNNRGNESTEKTSVKQGLYTIRNSKNVFFAVAELDGSDTGHNEEAHGDTHLTTNYKRVIFVSRDPSLYK